MCDARFAQGCQVWKNLWLLSSILFINMLEGKKIFPLCQVFPKVPSIMLKTINMLRKKLLYVSIIEENVWTSVMQGVAQ